MIGRLVAKESSSQSSLLIFERLSEVLQRSLGL
jgi:hypothetical protein